MAPNTPRHGAIAAEAIRLIANHLEGHPRCRVISEGAISPDQHNVRIPDLTVSCERLGLDDMLREPLLIVDITAPANAASTGADVVRYRTMPSLQEILLLQCMEIGATLYRRAPDTPWTQRSLSAVEDVTLDSIALTTPLAALYRTVA
jgi:Uma2 family endonuclease